MNKAEKDGYISWGNMSEEEKAEFFKSEPFKIIKNHDNSRKIYRGAYKEL